MVGATLYDIPAEEVFFFVVQTFNTSLLYLILNKPTFHPAFLQPKEADQRLKIPKVLGQVVLIVALIVSAQLVIHDGVGTYLGLIVGWAGPFMLLLW